MSIISSSRVPNNSIKDKCSSSLLNKSKSIDYVNCRSDILDNEKNIPNIFITPECNQPDGDLYPLSLLEREKDIPNVFNTNSFNLSSTYTHNYTDKYCGYPNLFTFNDIYSGSCSLNVDLWDKTSNYTSVFSLSDVQDNDYIHNFEISYSNNTKEEEEDNLISNGNLSHNTSIGRVSTSINGLDIYELNKTEKCSEENVVEKLSSAFCFWSIMAGANVRDHNIKTYYPQREISSTCIMEDIKLMLINMGSTYFLVDEETHMYKHNGNISITGLTPEMFWSVANPILKCTNLYKMLCITITKWKEMSEDNIVKAFIISVSNILNDYERTIYAVSNESLMSLVSRLSHLTSQLQLLANICCIKTCDAIIIPNCVIPCGVKLLNKIYDYLTNYRFPHDLFLKMLLYIFESCCLAYFRILSNWALKGILDDKGTGMFIKLKPDIENEDMCSRKHWDRFIIDESVEVPVFLDKYKNYILNCGKTINFFNKFNNLNVFLPEFTCCFDAFDTQRAYEQFSTYFKYDSCLKTENCVKIMSNSYLFQSSINSVHPSKNIDNNDVHNENIINITNPIEFYLNDESYELFQMPDWTFIDNTYDFNKPYGFFEDNNNSLTYNGQIFDVVNMLDYIPHSILIPARVQKNVYDKQILNMFFVQENLMGRLYYLSQCFFLMNGTFSSKLCENLFEGIITNRQQPINIFNPVKLKSIVDEAIQDSFFKNKQHNLTLEITFIPHLNGIIDISDVECVELNYEPEWPMNMILPSKILLKYRRIFMFANKLEYVSWSLSKARELLSVYKNNKGLQFRKINLFKHWMNQFVSSIQQYYKQIVISTCWSELNENFENIQNYDDLFTRHKQYMHTMLRRCLMVVGFKDKLILLNKLYIEILMFYQILASGQFYQKNSELLHSEFISLERSFSRFVQLREMFYISLLKAVQANGKHCVVQLESLITILGPTCNFT